MDRFFLSQISLGQISFGTNFSWVKFPFFGTNFLWNKFLLGQFSFGFICHWVNFFGSNFCWTNFPWDKFLLGQISFGTNFCWVKFPFFGTNFLWDKFLLGQISFGSSFLGWNFLGPIFFGSNFIGPNALDTFSVHQIICLNRLSIFQWFFQKIEMKMQNIKELVEKVTNETGDLYHDVSFSPPLSGSLIIVISPRSSSSAVTGLYLFTAAYSCRIPRCSPRCCPRCRAASRTTLC